MERQVHMLCSLAQPCLTLLFPVRGFGRVAALSCRPSAHPRSLAPPSPRQSVNLPGALAPPSPLGGPGLTREPRAPGGVASGEESQKPLRGRPLQRPPGRDRSDFHWGSVMLLLLGRAYVHVFISGNYKRLYNLLTVTIKPKTIKYGK